MVDRPPLYGFTRREPYKPGDSAPVHFWENGKWVRRWLVVENVSASYAMRSKR